MKISDLQKEAHAIAKEKGWWDTPRSIGELIASCHSELSAALEEIRNGRPLNKIYNNPQPKINAYFWSVGHVKPEGFPIELADLIIRVADMTESQGLSLDGLNNFLSRWEGSKVCIKTLWPIEVWIVDCHVDLSQAYIGWITYGIETRPSPYILNLEYLVSRVQSLCKSYNIDLETAIKIKMAYNKTRPSRYE